MAHKIPEAGYGDVTPPPTTYRKSEKKALYPSKTKRRVVRKARGK
jgi:hypothetical protein